MSIESARPFRAGQKKLSAGTLNSMLRAIRELQMTVDGGEASLIKMGAMNNTGAALDAYQIVGLGDADQTMSANPNNFLKSVVFKGELPASAYAGKFGITQEPSANGQIGRVKISGVSQCKVNVTDSDHAYADVTNGSVSYLTSQANPSKGCAEILWKESGTGEKWAIVRFPYATNDYVKPHAPTHWDAGTDELVPEKIGAKDLTGFVNRTDSTLSYASGVFSITPVGASFDVWSNGNRFTITTAQTVAIANNNTLHYVYFDTSGVLQVSTSKWTIASYNILVALVFRVSSSLAAVGDERHSFERDRRLHAWGHNTIGARYDFEEQGLNGVFDSSSLYIGIGSIWDEDLKHTLASPASTGRLWYRTGGGSTMTFEDNISLPFKVSGTTPQYDNSGTLTNVDVSKYFCSYVYMTNDITRPIYIQVGQQQHLTLALARQEGLPTFGALTTTEWKLLYRIIFKNVGGTATYTEAADYRQQLAGALAAYVPLQNHAILGSTHINTETETVEAGDLIYGNSTPNWARLAKGTNGYFLQMVAGYPAWVSAGGAGAGTFVHLDSVSISSWTMDGTWYEKNTGYSDAKAIVVQVSHEYMTEVLFRRNSSFDPIGAPNGGDTQVVIPTTAGKFDYKMTDFPDGDGSLSMRILGYWT